MDEILGPKWIVLYGVFYVVAISNVHNTIDFFPTIFYYLIFVFLWFLVFVYDKISAFLFHSYDSKARNISNNIENPINFVHSFQRTYKKRRIRNMRYTFSKFAWRPFKLTMSLPFSRQRALPYSSFFIISRTSSHKFVHFISNACIFFSISFPFLK